MFGDNEARVGRGGQAAACRGLPNTIGITTKKAPRYDEAAYYSDDDYHDWCNVNQASFSKILELTGRGEVVFYPNDGIETGLAKLSEKAPTIQAHIDRFFDEDRWK